MLLFCGVPVIALYIEYIKIWVENFHSTIYTNYKTYLKFLSYFFAIVKDICLSNYLER